MDSNVYIRCIASIVNGYTVSYPFCETETSWWQLAVRYDLIYYLQDICYFTYE
jgi:hypothetical protein